MSARGKGVGLGDSIESLMRRLDRKNKGAYLQTKVARAWTEMAGETVLAHTTGAHLRGKELVIFVDSPIWATELSALSGEYQRRLNETLGKEAVTSVRFTVSRKVGEERRFEALQQAAEEAAEKDRVDSVPLTESERAQVEASASAIEDEALREAVVRATVADLEWKKGLNSAKNR